jgi:hypothetical protein
MSVIYEALKKAEESRAAAQGMQLQPVDTFADAMPNFRIGPLICADKEVVRGTADHAKA